MTKQEAAFFKKGDVVYKRSEPDEERTVVAYLSPTRGWLAIRGIIEMNHRSVKFWDCASIQSEKDLAESLECIGLKYLCITNPALWIKEAS